METLIAYGIIAVFLVISHRRLSRQIKRVDYEINKNIQEMKTRQSFSREREKHIVTVVDRILKKADRLLGKKVIRKSN